MQQEFIISNIFQLITFIILFIFTIIIFIRDPKYQGNQFLAIAYFGILINVLMIIISRFEFSEEIINIVFRVSIMGIILGIPCLTLGIWIFCESWNVVKKTIFFKIFPLIIGMLWIVVWIPDFITIQSLQTLNIQRNPIYMLSITIWIFINLIYTLIRLRRVITSPNLKDKKMSQKLKKLLLTIYLTFGIPISSILEGITGSVIFTISQSIFSLIITLILASFILKRK
ncbi:MAG: hypothetical protein JXA99_00495 [Candidatus Lokiarchaeota archaeon]|nr:hypothetical protein [Candidatus Lokiarchaeota archaeon]